MSKFSFEYGEENCLFWIFQNIGVLLARASHTLKLANKEYPYPDARTSHATDVIWPLESISDASRVLGCKHAMFWQI
jgi:hypothetical protein